MTRPFRTEPPKHAHVSKTLKIFMSLKGRRIALAQDRRIRLKAQRLGYFACKSRTVGGWSLRLWQHGEIIAGPMLTDYELEGVLNDLANKKSAAICTGRGSLNSHPIAKSKAK